METADGGVLFRRGLEQLSRVRSGIPQVFDDLAIPLLDVWLHPEEVQFALVKAQLALRAGK
jgi:hypothetical protein